MDIDEYGIDKFYENLVDRELSRQHQWRVTNIQPGFDGGFDDLIDQLGNKILCKYSRDRVILRY